MSRYQTVGAVAVLLALLSACSAASPQADPAASTGSASGSASPTTSMTAGKSSSTAPSPIGSPAPSTDPPIDESSLPVLVVHPLTGEADYAVVRPAEIAYSIDVNATIKDITWTSWTATSAVGRGSHVQDDCKPDCATGKIVLAPTIITLTDPVGGQFTSLTETVGGKSQTVTGSGLIEGAGANPTKLPVPHPAGSLSTGTTAAASPGPSNPNTSEAASADPSGSTYNDPDELARALLADEVAQGIAATNVTCTFTEPHSALCQLTLTNVPNHIPARVIVSDDGRSYHLQSSG